MLLVLYGLVSQTWASSLMARGQGDRYWLVVPITAADKSATTSVRRLADPVTGRWTEISRLGVRVVDAAPLGDRLAVLTEGGNWRLLWDGGDVAGPQAPNGYVLQRLSSAGETLWAIASNSNGPPAILTWNEADGWTVQSPLPAGTDPAKMGLSIFNGTPWVCYIESSEVVTTRFPFGPKDRWLSPQGYNRSPSEIDAAALFVQGSGRPVIVLSDQVPTATLFEPLAGTNRLTKLGNLHDAS